MVRTRLVIGMDEVGRGAWAGPLVACAVFVGKSDRLVRGVRDSKSLLPKRRQLLSGRLQTRHTFGIGIVTVVELDQWGMTKAQEVVFERAMEALLSPRILPTPRLRRAGKSGMTIQVDGLPIKSHPKWQGIIDGDRTVYSIAAASIIAKVHRDQMMRDLHAVECRYRFDLHKGYGTELHQRLLQEHGPSSHHRRLFEPVRQLYRV